MRPIRGMVTNPFITPRLGLTLALRLRIVFKTRYRTGFTDDIRAETMFNND